MMMMMMMRVYILLIFLIDMMITLVEGKLRTFELNIGEGDLNPDCGKQVSRVMLVNGQYPGPPLRATMNDDIHIIVRNIGTRESTTVHYHGILQIGTTESDGMPNVTQAAIPPGGEYHQRFQLIDQVGTYFYHAHVGLQDESIQGPFIIYPSDDAWPPEALHDNSFTDNNKDVEEASSPLKDGPYEYDDERIIQLSEWWAESAESRLAYYLGNYYKGFVAADQYLINGRGGKLKGISHHDNNKRHDNDDDDDDDDDEDSDSNGDDDDDDQCPGLAAIDVKHGKVYRFRVIGALTFASVGFSIAEHNMTVIEVDGNLIQPFETTYLEVSSGQRFSVLVKANQAPGTSYNIATKPYWITNTTTSGHAIMNYVGGSSGDRTRTDLIRNCPPAFARTTLQKASNPTKPYFPKQFNQWFFPDMEPLEPKKHDFSTAPDRTIVLMPKEHIMKDNTTRWLINNHPPPEWQVPIIDELRLHVEEGLPLSRRAMNNTAMQMNRDGTWDGYDDSLQTYPIQHNEIIDVVIHTTTLINHGICASHPWHSHGFQHYPIADGGGEYDHEQDKDIRTYLHPIPRDTTLVYPVDVKNKGKEQKHGVPCGWTKIRIFATNPGLWAFHCHITGHMLQGMIIVMDMATDQIAALQQ
ncbi:Cupredoxin [Halteromyces radiatus]|uniref:Cupredoxin n=1 Tax=Halteromyces radiatus TaxID=101107 RepID=UPI00221EF158|nr:Cupredoxin [Halteromyces radiatus]KAI8099209.1 Cupredoxin [Halteromyces radiatus]